MFKKSITFTTELISEGSWGQRDLGKHESTMELFLHEDKFKGGIEWDIPSLDTTEEIGLWFTTRRDLPLIEIDGEMIYTRELMDYDGVFSLPSQAIELIRSIGFIVPEEYE